MNNTDFNDAYPWIREALKIRNRSERIEYLEKTLLELDEKINKIEEIRLDHLGVLMSDETITRKQHFISDQIYNGLNINRNELNKELSALTNFYYSQNEFKSEGESDDARTKLLILYLLIKFEYLKDGNPKIGSSLLVDQNSQKNFLGDLLNIPPSTLENHLFDLGKTFEKDLTPSEARHHLKILIRLESIFENSIYPDILQHIKARIIEVNKMKNR